ncbi:MAG: type IV pilus secretin PilQ [Alysiella sp.]|uniref:type IV pilus secretin PilQ n=1 Tax=Alysiella sp. TaxID=1872483 RepID=UPI0026DAC217|nr:type IV pilus secretin PilQ [Alysiella sp.]MDO4434176.1 type IV pilus secretin PilQ [Alysiella sp.]
MKRNSIKIMSAALFAVGFQAAWAGNIVDINASVLDNNQRLITVRFDKDAVEPSGFITTNPSRIALDFAKTDLALKQSTFSFNDPILNQIITAKDNQHARISLNLGKEAQYNAQVKGNEVLIYISEANSSNQAVAQTTRAANGKNQPTMQHPGHGADFNIDFRKGENGAAIIDYVANYAGQPHIQKLSDRLIITLKNHPLATQNQRNLDVADFSTPVRTIAVKRVGNDTQITIRNQGSWGYKTSSNNGRQTIQINQERNVAYLGISDKKDNNFKGKTISLDFQNIDVRTVLQILSKESGMNIVASDTVQGKMTLSLKDVPWDQALNLVLDARNLEMKRQGNIINVAPREEMMKKNRDELNAQNEIQTLGPLLSRTFQLKYKNVEEFRDILNLENSTTDSSRSILSGRGSALIDPSTNTLIITDNQFVMQKFERLIEELDVPARQVMVEARIVEASDGVSRELGVKFGYGRSSSSPRMGVSANWEGARVNSNNNGGSIEFGPNINLPVTSALGSSIALVRHFSSNALGLELSALETENRTKTISTPRVLTQDRKEAEIKQGLQIPYTTRDTNGSTSTAFKDATMSLKVKPRITPDNKIILDIEINKDEPDYTRTNIEGEPGISTKQVKTQAMIEDGGTLVVGGIYQEVQSNVMNKVPLLGDIPIIGNLFKKRAREQSRNELLFFITPRIMGQENSVLRY